MKPSRLVLVTVASAALVAACGSSSNEASTAATGGASDTSCPTAAPAADAKPDWTVTGASGSAEVIGSTETAAPEVTVQGPLSVNQTQVHTLREGTGAQVAQTATVSVCYLGVNGRDGKVFDSAYERGTPAEFPLTGVVPGFSKAIAGQKVGSTVAVAMVPADGYPQGQPDAGIQPGDSLIFVLEILSARG